MPSLAAEDAAQREGRLRAAERKGRQCGARWAVREFVSAITTVAISGFRQTLTAKTSKITESESHSSVGISFGLCQHFGLGLDEFVAQGVVRWAESSLLVAEFFAQLKLECVPIFVLFITIWLILKEIKMVIEPFRELSVSTVSVTLLLEPVQLPGSLAPLAASQRECVS